MINWFLRLFGFRPTFGKKTTPAINRKPSIPMLERRVMASREIVE